MKYIVYMKFSSIVLILLLFGSPTAQTHESRPSQTDDGDPKVPSRTQSSKCVTNKPIDADLTRLIVQGMQIEVVSVIMGSDGCVSNDAIAADSVSDTHGLKNGMLSWIDDNGDTLTVSFKNGLVTLLDVSREAIDDSASFDLEYEKYIQIGLGMSNSEVEGILGMPGEETSNRTSGEKVYTSYKWSGGDFVRIYVSFADDEMTSKSQFGLKRGSSGEKASITMAKYEKIENGMDFSEVEKIIGSKGEVTSSSTIGSFQHSSYKWKGEKYSNITVRFRDGKVVIKSQYGLK